MNAPAKALNRGVAPVTYGHGERPPRGDYASAASDYTCAQAWSQYTPEQHALYRRLHQRQTAQLPGLACDEFIESLRHLGEPDHIPRFDDINARLYPATRWEVVAVPGLIPEEAFFALLAKRKFPVTEWLRKPEEFDYVVEPDVFHDLYGHVPLLFNPVFADYMQAYGEGGLKASRLDACELLARLYWYTVEFGLILTPQGLAGLWRGHPVVGRRTATQRAQRRTAARGFRPAAADAHALQDRRFPEHLLRHRRLRAAVRRHRA